jgi:hypothetical protein
MPLPFTTEHNANGVLIAETPIPDRSKNGKNAKYKPQT